MALISANQAKPSTQPTLSPAMKLPKQTPLCLAVAQIYPSTEPFSDSELSVLMADTPQVDSSDFPEGREDPAQSDELERQQDA